MVMLGLAASGCIEGFGAPDFLVDGPVHQQLLRLAATSLAHIVDIGRVGKCHENGDYAKDNHQLNDGETPCPVSIPFVHVRT
jgi:hypothetical protein